MNKEAEIRLAIQRALIGNVSKHLRLICCNWKEGKWLFFRFYTDIIPTEEEKELASCILTDLESDLGFLKIDYEVIYSKDPYEKLDKLKLVVYWRNEIKIL